MAEVPGSDNSCYIFFYLTTLAIFSSICFSA
jgi:hypothetical protein